MRADEARDIVVLGEEFGQYDYVCRYARISPSIVPELVGQVDVSKKGVGWTAPVR